MLGLSFSFISFNSQSYALFFFGRQGLIEYHSSRLVITWRYRYQRHQDHHATRWQQFQTLNMIHFYLVNVWLYHHGNKANAINLPGIR